MKSRSKGRIHALLQHLVVGHSRTDPGKHKRPNRQRCKIRKHLAGSTLTFWRKIMNRQILTGLVLLFFVPSPSGADETEDKAVQALKSLWKVCVVINRDDKKADKPVFAVQLFPVATWLIGSRSSDFKEDTDESYLKHLAAFKQLRELELFGTPVTGKGLKELASLKDLRKLSLWTKMTDADLKELVPLKQLEELSLRGTPVTDAGIKELAFLTQLRVLKLFGLKLTDAGLKELAPLRNCEHSKLKHCE